MKKHDIEKLLNNAAESIVPDVLDRVKKADVEVLPYTERERRGSRVFLRRLALTLSLIIMFFAAGGTFAGLAVAEAETVYLDINPSVELVLNYYGNVKEINYNNEDAASLFAAYQAKGKNIEKVIGYFVEKAEESGYFATEDSVIYVSVSAKNSKKAERNAEKYKNYANDAIKARGLSSAEAQKQNASDVSKTEADSLNISVGKLKLIKQIIAANPDYTVEELADLEMNALNRILKGSNGGNNGGDNGNGSGR